jgi:hypothetical protein
MALIASGEEAEVRDMVLEGIGGPISPGMVATLARSIVALPLLASNTAAAVRPLGFVLQQHAADTQRLGPREVVYRRLRRALAQAPTEDDQGRLTAEAPACTEAKAVAAALRTHETAAASRRDPPAS